MGNGIRRWWKYAGAAANSKLEERADPKIQLQQALEEAQRQHAALSRQAAAVIGNQRQLEMKMARQAQEVTGLNDSARQALVLADQASARGDAAAAASYQRSAQAFATQLVTAEAALEDLKNLHAQAVQGAEAARQAVEQNSQVLRDKLAQRSKLLTQLEQAKMQEQIASSMAGVSELTGSGSSPTLDGVRDKIEARYATAMGATELASSTVDAQMLDVHRASIDAAASSRLEQLRASMASSSPDQAITQGATPQLESGSDAETSEPGAQAGGKTDS